MSTTNKKENELNKIFTGAFIFNSESLDEMIKTIEKRMGRNSTKEYTIEFNNGLSLHPTEIDEIYSEPNNKYRKITQILITFESGRRFDNNYKRIRLNIGDYSSKIVRLSINSFDRDWTDVTETKIEEELMKYKEKYSYLYALKEKLILQPIVFISLFVLLFFVLTKSISLNQFITKDNAVLFAYGVVFLTYLLTSVMLKIIYFIFPEFVIAIGEQEKNLKRSIEFRKGIFWTIFIGGLVVPGFLYLIKMLI